MRTIQTKRTYCTYFDSNYLIKGLALIASLNRWETSEFRLFVVCLDVMTREILEKLHCPNLILVPLADIEAGDAALEEARGNRTRVEYYWTLTPTVIRHFLAEVPQGDSVTYLDADLFFYSSPEPIFAEFAGHSVLIHGHRFSPSQKHLEVFGKYNVGLLCFRRDDQGLTVLNWWRERCNEWCYDRPEDGKYGDQLYLNDFPERFPGVRVLEHIGAGVAPWNNDQYAYGTDRSGRPQVSGQPLIFYHFHALVFVTEALIVPAKHVSYPLPRGVIELCVTPYIDSLVQAVAEVRALVPDFSKGLMDRNVWGLDHTFVARKELAPSIGDNGVNHPRFDLGNGWECYVTTQLTRVPVLVHREISEPDLAATSPIRRDEPCVHPGTDGHEEKRQDQSPPAEFVVATSIAPKEIAKQQAAIATWFDLGFRVLSVNNANEIELLQPYFPQVRFVAAARNAQNHVGKPLIYFDDMLKTLVKFGSAVCGIVNSDIHLRADEHFIRFITQEARNSFVYGSRVNILSPGNIMGESYDCGFDFFFFDKAVAGLYPPTPFAIGATWWDYWAVIVPLLRGYTVKKLTSPLAFHIVHALNWSREEWRHFGALFSTLVKEWNFDFPSADLNESTWMFLNVVEISTAKISYNPYGENVGFPARTAPAAELGNGKESSPTAPVPSAGAKDPAQAEQQLHCEVPRETDLRGKSVASQLPRISLVIPSYNYGRYLEACLDSIISQGYPNLELIIMDGGSTDDTLQIIRRYEKHLAYWQSGPDGGQYSAIQEGFRRSTGEIMGWLNADDMFHPGAFAVVSDIFLACPEVEWLTGRPNREGRRWC